MSKWRTALLELGKPYVAFFRGCAKFLASLVCVGKGEIPTTDLFTDQG